MTTFNYNIGILGHIDSGKTSLVRVLSSVLSTAALDKHPESQKRGITLDLGFSALTLPMPAHLSSTHTSLQLTLVDCPGHASLIRTIIAGASIIDKMILVIDATKGFQTQTAECVVISELLLSSSLIVALNKIDLLDKQKLQQIETKVSLILNKTKFAGNYRMVKVAACPREGEPIGINELIGSVVDSIRELPDRSPKGPLYYEIDHCFPVKGLGCVLTGTVMEGALRVGDSIEILHLKTQKKVKSMQMFHQNINEAFKGDRVGVCIGPFDSKLIERAVACTPNTIRCFQLCVVKVFKISYFKHSITSKSKYHITCGNQTVMGSCVFFSSSLESGTAFSSDVVYGHENELIMSADKQFFAVLALENEIPEPTNNGLIIGSKFDLDCNSKQCRIGFYGHIQLIGPELSSNAIKVCKQKKRTGLIERIIDQYTAIGINMFTKDTDITRFEGLKVKVGESRGEIVSSFGKSGKFKINFPDGNAQSGEIVLEFKKMLWDKNNLMVQ